LKVQAGIKQVATDLSQVKGALKAHNKGAGKRNGYEQAKPKAAAPIPVEKLKEPAKADPREIVYHPEPEFIGSPSMAIKEVTLDAKASIQRIIDAILALNCPACSGGFVLAVAKNELKKWDGSCREQSNSR
jgi:hypothetical protein